MLCDSHTDQNLSWETQVPVPEERRLPGRSWCYLCLLFANSFSRVTGKHEHRGQDRVTPSQPLNKGRGTVTPTEKKKLFQKYQKREFGFVPTTESICQQQTKNATQLSHFISIDHSSTHIHLFRAGESKKMKGQLV